jgi:hypothetical protein
VPRPLEEFRASDPLSQIVKMAALTRRHPTVRPVVTVHCSNGHDFRGVVLDVNESTNESAVLLDTTSNGSFETTICYISGSTICALTVHDVLRTDLEAPEPEPVSNLQLGRLFAEFEKTIGADRISTIDGLTENDNPAVARALAPIAAAIDAIAKEPMGAKALQPIRTLLFSVGDQDNVRRNETELAISVTRSVSAASDADSWKRLLEANL